MGKCFFSCVCSCTEGKYIYPGNTTNTNIIDTYVGVSADILVAFLYLDICHERYQKFRIFPASYGWAPSQKIMIRKYRPDTCFHAVPFVFNGNVM